jgi:hypothetical protein
MSGVQPEDAARLPAVLARSAQEFTPIITDIQFLLGSGDTRCFETHMVPKQSADGTISWRGASVDVTERRRSERLLRLLHNVSVAIAEAPEYETAVRHTLRYMCRVADAVCGRVGRFGLKMSRHSSKTTHCGRHCRNLRLGQKRHRYGGNDTDHGQGVCRARPRVSRARCH